MQTRSPGARARVIVVGDVMVDVSVDSGALASAGDVPGRVRIRPGGAGANTAVWAAAAGADVELIARIGDDLPGRLLQSALEERGVRPSLIVDEESSTGSMLVVRQRGDRSMVADRGANAHLSPGDLPSALRAEAIVVCGYLLFDAGSNAGGRAAVERAEAPFVAVDASSWPLLQSFGAGRFIEETSGANILLANEREAEILSNGDPETLPNRYEHVFIKRGRFGAAHGTKSGWVRRAPAEVAAASDVTGAGDAFDGALMAALASGCPFGEALDLACRAGGRAAASLDTWPEP